MQLIPGEPSEIVMTIDEANELIGALRWAIQNVAPTQANEIVLNCTEHFPGMRSLVTQSKISINVVATPAFAAVLTKQKLG